MTFIQFLIIGSGLTQVLIAVSSLAVPVVLDWKSETAKLAPLTQQVFWTYAAYIWTINMCMGLLSLFASKWLLDGSPLATAIAAFTATYWGTRTVIQFACFKIDGVPNTAVVKLGTVAMDTAFVCLTVVYAAVALGVR